MDGQPSRICLPRKFPLVSVEIEEGLGKTAPVKVSGADK
jgi:hypothetical protein